MSASALPARTPQRRQVTVLFLDVTDSTLLTRALDPEEVLEVMDAALRRFAAVVAAHGGQVLQYAGDSVLAVFGAEQSREDDPERAVHAGLALLAAAREHAAEVARTHRVAGFGVRVGVHTGDVLLGGGVDAGTIRGYTVNVAARLEQSAPAGAVRVSQETWRQVRGVFEGAAQPPLQAKGVDEPLLTWLVSGVRPRAFRSLGRGVDGLDTAFVGRDAEIARLLDAFERSAGGLQTVTLLADAGLGKSRMLHELQLRLDAGERRCRLLTGRAQPAARQQPFGLLRDVLAWRLQIADGDSADAARAKLVRGLLPFFAADGGDGGDETPALRQAELLGQLVGMDFSASPRIAAELRDARLLRDGALAALATWLQRLAGGDSVVLLLDDLQWADDASLDLIEPLQRRTGLPLLLLLAARPALLERRPAWGQGWQRHETMVLAPLHGDGRRALLQTLLQRVDDAPAALTALLDEQAEGNPYHAEELLQMLVDSGAIDATGERWRVSVDRLAAAKVPGTLIGVLQARLDALAAHERRTIQAASIVGPVFWDDALAIFGDATAEALPALQHKALVRPRPDSAFQDTREEAFQHHLLHQVTYDSLLKAERRSGHAHAAQWLAGRVGDRAAEYLALTADHYERAGDGARAIEWLDRAARAAQDRYANGMALAAVARLLAMPELVDDRRRCELLRRQTGLADLVGDRALQAAALDGQQAIAERLNDDDLLAEALADRMLLADRTGRYDEAQALAQRTAALAESADNAAIAAMAHGELGWLALQRGEHDAAEALLQTGRRHAREAAIRRRRPSDDSYEVMLLTILGIAQLERHQHPAAAATLNEALALANQRHHLRSVCGCLDWLASAALAVSDAPLARRHVDALAAAAAQTGNALVLTAIPRFEAELALLAGRHEEAVALARASADAAAKLSSGYGVAAAAALAAVAHAALGAWPAAREQHERARDAYAALGLDKLARAQRVAIADTWRAEGDTVRALALLEPELEALAAPAPLADGNGSAATQAAAWRVLAAAHDPRTAQHLALAHGALQALLAHADDAARERMLRLSPRHREIVAAWGARG